MARHSEELSPEERAWATSQICKPVSPLLEETPVLKEVESGPEPVSLADALVDLTKSGVFDPWPDLLIDDD
jgi:hypothetical protein